MSVHDYKYVLSKFEILLEEAEKADTKEVVLELIRREIRTLRKVISTN
jgi:hypothetical protein